LKDKLLLSYTLPSCVSGHNKHSWKQTYSERRWLRVGFGIWRRKVEGNYHYKRAHDVSLVCSFIVDVDESVYSELYEPLNLCFLSYLLENCCFV